jgi:serine/threonine-protein kinase
VPAANTDAEDAAVNELLDQRLGNYWIESFLGDGGMARVYLARHLTLERPCAIKVLRPSVAARDPGAVELFLAEARAAAALVHPHVVALHTIGHEMGYHFIEMEFVDGASLAHLLGVEGAASATEATRWMVEVSSALGMAHGHGIIHRDIKPANIMISLDRRTKLADFGLAKRLVARLEGREARSLAGTPQYMAPELFFGVAADCRSDIYSMGVTYYRLLTGRLPVEFASIADVVRVHSAPAEVNLDSIREGAGEAASRLLRRCLAYDRLERFSSAVELHDAFRAVYGSLRSLESLAREAVAETGVQLEGSGDQFVAKVPLEGGRFQRVCLEIADDSGSSDQVITLYSVCAPIDSRYFRRALELNSRIPHGSIAIQNVRGEPHFVMSNSYPRNTCDPEEIRRSLFTIAKYADEWEQRLTGRDVN